VQAITPAIRRRVELGDAHRKRRHEFKIQTPRRGQAVEEGLLREAIHLDYPIARSAASAKCERSIRALTRRCAGLRPGSHHQSVAIPR
jgi:hypothetical protein